MKLIIIFFSFFIFISCSDQKNKNEQNPEENISVEVIDDSALEDIIRSRNKKILFINVWATWCEPCVEEFPDLVKLHKEYKNDVDFLSLSADFVSEIDSKIEPFLKKQNAGFPVYVIKEDKTEQVIKLLSNEWNGALPATFIFDKQGSQKQFFLGLQSYGSFKKSIDSIKTL